MRIAILGNSGSGKSTLARWLGDRSGAPVLDLDTVAWDPGKIAVPRNPDVAAAEVRAFCAAGAHWIIEGCYAELIGIALESSPRLVFLNPGTAQCRENCRTRPWEPHKYATEAEQDERLSQLLEWVDDYTRRDGELSLSGHRRCFAGYEGPKVEVTSQLVFDPPDPVVVAWLR